MWKMARKTARLSFVLFAATLTGASFAGAPQANTPQSWEVLQLTAQDPRESTNGSTCGSLLVRELQRQAILLAARDELRIATRDMALEERFAPESPTCGTLLAGTQFWVGGGMQNFLMLPGGPGAEDASKYLGLDIDKYAAAAPDKLVFRAGVPVAKSPLIDYPQLIGAMEKQSREVAGPALGRVIAAPALNNPIWSDFAEPPKEALQALDEMHPVAQLLALRQIHEIARTQGGSPAILEALARGYANLGLMTQPLYSGMYKTYMARSLLYAERLAVRWPNSARVLQTRAYARAMAGLAAPALEDLAAAEKIEDPGAPPAWVPIIKALCRYDLAGMKKLAGNPGECQPLAQMLLIAIATDQFAQPFVTDAGTQCLAADPDNVWAMQQLCRTGQLGFLAEMPPQIERSIRRDAHAHAALLPAKAQPLVQKLAGDSDDAALAACCKSLDELAATDRGEPSLGALASILRDEQFLAIQLHTKYLTVFFGAPPEDVAQYVHDAAPGWQDHPLAPMIRFLTARASGDSKAVRAALDALHPTDGGTWYFDEIFAGLTGADYKDKWPVWLQTEAHSDMLAIDHNITSLTRSRLDRDAFLAEMRDLSPDCAMVRLAQREIVAQDKRTPEMTASFVADVKARFSDRYPLISSAAEDSLMAMNTQSAEDLLAEAFHANPSFQNASDLLRIYEISGRFEKARAVIDAAMELPSYGLEKSFVSSEYAYALMSRSRAADALAYAKIAGDSYSSTGLACLANNEDILGDKDKVRALLRANAERYPGGELRWYSWALRTGSPDTADAKKALAAFLESHPDSYNATYLFHMLNGETEQAMSILKTRETNPPSVYDTIEYGVLAEELGNHEKAVARLKLAAGYAGDYDLRDIAITLSAIAQGKDARVAVEGFECGRGPSVQGNDELINYQYGWLARYLAATGHEEEARRIFPIALALPWSTHELYYFTWKAAEKLKIDAAKAIQEFNARKIDVAPLLGTWKFQEGATTGTWTFTDDGIVTDSAGVRDIWWECNNRIMVYWSPNHWSVLPLPLGHVVHVDTPVGAGNLVLTKQ